MLAHRRRTVCIQAFKKKPHTSFFSALRRLLEGHSVSSLPGTTRPQNKLLKLLQVGRLSAIQLRDGALRVRLGGAGSSGGVLLVLGLDIVGFRGGGGGIHDGMWVTQLVKVKMRGVRVLYKRAKVIRSHAGSGEVRMEKKRRSVEE